MPDKFLTRSATTGQVTEVVSRDTSSGTADAGRIPALDAAGRLASSMMPAGIGADTLDGTANGALSAGDLVFVNGTSITRASAAVGGSRATRYVLAASLTGAAASALKAGRITGLTGLTAGSRYYLSDVTPGGITATPVSGAGKLHQFVGVANSTTSLDFEPDDSITLA